MKRKYSIFYQLVVTSCSSSNTKDPAVNFRPLLIKQTQKINKVELMKAIVLRNQIAKNSYVSAVVRFGRVAVLVLALPLLLNFSLSGCAQPDTIAPVAASVNDEQHSAAREAASLLNSDSFENTRLSNFWRPELMTKTAGSISSEQQRVGKKSMRFGWKPSQADGTNKMLHSELATDPLVNGETERWHGYSSFMPSATMADDDQIAIVSQWHGVADPGFEDSVPPLRIEVKSNRLQLVYVASSKPIVKLLQTPTSHKEIDLGPVSYDRWVDYVVHVKWDSNGNTGVLQVWQDGVLKVNEQNINIGYPQIRKPYWKVGLYCWTGKSKHTERTIYCDEVRIGGASANYDAVKPGRSDNSAR